MIRFQKGNSKKQCGQRCQNFVPDRFLMVSLRAVVRAIKVDWSNPQHSPIRIENSVLAFARPANDSVKTIDDVVFGCGGTMEETTQQSTVGRWQREKT